MGWGYYRASPHKRIYLHPAIVLISCFRSNYAEQLNYMAQGFIILANYYNLVWLGRSLVSVVVAKIHLKAVRTPCANWQVRELA